MMRVPVPRLHLIGPLDEMDLDAYLTVAEAASRGGCDGIHVRTLKAGAGRVLEVIRELRERLPNCAIIVNDRLDLALLGLADGVQLGEQSMTAQDARSLCGNHLLIGRSIHDANGAQQAERDGADYLLAGHIFDTPSKPGQPGRGIDWLSSISRSVSVPVIALGGITVERIPEVLAAGAHGVAMGREILQAADPAGVARAAYEGIERQKGIRNAAG